MKIHTEMEQNSVDWQILRSGKITASEMDSIISPLGKVRDSDGVDTYVAQKLCEMWTGGPLVALQGVFDVDQGRLLEERAKPAFTVHTGIETHNVAFIETDDGRVGCSPDAMIGNESGAEIKCPRIDTHVAYLLAGKLPKPYVAQVQGSMYVTGCKTWHFFSYCRSMPPLHLVVKRDEAFQQALADAITLCIARLDEAMARLTEINGGPPRSLKPLTPLPPRPKPTVPQPRPDAKPLHELEIVP